MIDKLGGIHMEIMVIAYFVIIIIFAIYLSCLYLRDKNSYMKIACQRLFTTIQCMENEIVDLDIEIEKIYIGYSNNVQSVKRVYPNVMTWLDDIIYRVNADFRYARKLKPYIKEIKSARNKLLEKYPYFECEKEQQEMLGDLKKLEKIDGKLRESFVVENLITRLQKEFLRLNLETKKNSKINVISIFVSIISIAMTIVSIIN